MKLLCSNPDTIGDMVLREPMYRALLSAGHELMLIVRSSVVPLLPYVAPGAAVVELPAEVYADDLDARWDQFTRVFEAARRFQPDAMVVAPYRWTGFEEKLSDELKDLPLRRYGMSGQLYAGNPNNGTAPASKLTFDVTAPVNIDDPEVEKNAALAAAILGHPLERREPRLEPDPSALTAAREILNRLGFVPGEYWIGCVTGTVNVPIKGWPPENWAQLLSAWPHRPDRKFLFVGIPKERPGIDQVRQMMGDAAGRTAISSDDQSGIAELIALSALSSGYVGHDTGPMHIAAALGKPVLAVFGQGHRLRFAPRVAPSVVVSMGVACAGCEWTCSFAASHCVKAVPIEEVVRAADDLESGRVSGAEARVLPPSDELLDRMIRESADLARRRLRVTGDLNRQLQQQVTLTIQPLQAALAARVEQANGLSARIAEIEGSRESACRELTQVREQLLRQRQETARWAERESDLRRQLDARSDEIEQLSNRIRELEPDGTTAGARWLKRFVGPSLPWRQFVENLITGRREYVPRTGPRELPTILLVVAMDESTNIADVRATIDSILRQHYLRLQLIVAPIGNVSFQERIPDVAIAPVSDSYFGAIAAAFGRSSADVVGWLDSGDLLEQDALEMVGKFFRDHPREAGAVFNDTIEKAGLRVRATPPRLDVYSLLNGTWSDAPARVSIFMRRLAYRRLGGLDISFGPAAGLHLWLRLARRHGFARSDARVVFRRRRGRNGSSQSWNEALSKARGHFKSRFWLPGRVRCRLIHWAGDARWISALIWERRIIGLHCPIPAATNQTGPSDAVIAALSRFLRIEDAAVEFAHAGEPGATLGSQARWKVSCISKEVSADSQGQLAAWENAPEGALESIPADRSFDAIWLASPPACRSELLTLLRRLRLLLKPGGFLIFDGPNLKSRLIDLQGVSWRGWKFASENAFTSRRELKRLAPEADLRLSHYSTVTLCADPNLRAWARLLWDWRGLGDQYIVLLQNGGSDQ